MTARPLTLDDLSRLVCPVCHQPLGLEEIPLHIRCLGCARTFPIRDGLPVLIDGSAKTTRQA